LADIPALLHRFAIQPKKSLGQNFLVDEAALSRIVAAAELGPEDTVLEIGPGLGTLTRRLAEAADRVIAVELDDRLIPALRYTLAPYRNVEIVHGDILELNVAELIAPDEKQPVSYKVVANLPYYITSAVLRHLLEAPIRPALMVLTVQLEVAQRLASGPGDMSLLAVSVQVYGQPRVIARIKAGSFYPAPKVDSAVVRVDLYEQPVVPLEDIDSFFEVARAGFGERRKQLRNALSRGLGRDAQDIALALEQAGVDPARRAETLSLEEWVRVYLRVYVSRV
jgi:16S rRNA (adenine1518-N6/adenine1519-N6)-dimethyltransferase